jgi:hypothetical protein
VPRNPHGASIDHDKGYVLEESTSCGGDWSAMRPMPGEAAEAPLVGASLSSDGLPRCDQRYGLRLDDLGFEGAPARLNERLEANDVGDARSRHPPDSWLAIVASMTVKRIPRGDEMLMKWLTEWAARLSTSAAVEFPV